MIRTMDDFGQLLDAMNEALRSFGAEFTSAWFPIQVGLLVLAAAIAFGIARWVRKHVQVKSIMTGWPGRTSVSCVSL